MELASSTREQLAYSKFFMKDLRSVKRVLSTILRPIYCFKVVKDSIGNIAIIIYDMEGAKEWVRYYKANGAYDIPHYLVKPQHHKASLII